jgi:transcriptional regulator with XRE-family HTH domain
MSTSLGSRLKAAREAAKLPRTVVARKAGIDTAMLFRIENAANSDPTFRTVARIAAVLGISLDSLAEGAVQGSPEAIDAARQHEALRHVAGLLRRATAAVEAAAAPAAATRPSKRRRR